MIRNGVTAGVYELQDGDELVFSMKKNIDDTGVALRMVLTDGNTFHIRPADTAALAFGKYKYDVQLTMKNGDVYTVIPPTIFEITPEVTV